MIHVIKHDMDPNSNIKQKKSSFVISGLAEVGMHISQLQSILVGERHRFSIYYLRNEIERTSTTKHMVKNRTPCTILLLWQILPKRLDIRELRADLVKNHN